MEEFAQHNEEARAVWAAYCAGNPIRVPVKLGTDIRFFLLDKAFNPNHSISFRDYSQDPLTMMDVQLRAAVWRAFHIAPHCDDKAGFPDKFVVTVDMQRYFEAGFFGATVEYRTEQTPDSAPLLEGERKYWLFERGLPNPLTGGVFEHAHRLYEAMDLHLQNGFTYAGRPVELAPFGLDTDGPLTVATNLRGIELYTDMYIDPDYVRQLLDMIVEGTVIRIRAHRRFFGLPEVAEDWAYADDAIQMISTDMLEEFVLPVHRKLKKALTTAEKISIHLCGDSTRHFKLLHDELGISSFDTGFPVDLGELRRSLGPDVEILGGPRVPLLLTGSPAQVAAETERVLKSGVIEGGHFILREANDLAPGTPLANLAAMYQTTRRYGRYS